jgi:heptosyltransferase III
MKGLKHIIISRTDAIGDVVLTLPMVGYLKELYPELKISFIGRTYTKSVVLLSKHIDQFINWDDWTGKSPELQAGYLKGIGADAIVHIFPDKEIARAASLAGIAMRIGTSHRLFHWSACNRLVNFSRKNSDLHEAQLNFKLLRPLKITYIPDKESLHNYYGYPSNPIQISNPADYIQPGLQNIILHPRSKGSAREWGLDNFSELIRILPADKYNIIVCGTQPEGESMVGFLNDQALRVINLTGKLSLEDYIKLISNCDALVAASTGPLHIASALGIKSIGLYAPMRPIDSGRWGPIGLKASALSINKNCNDCRNTFDCHCIRSITPEMVKRGIER